MRIVIMITLSPPVCFLFVSWVEFNPKTQVLFIEHYFITVWKCIYSLIYHNVWNENIFLTFYLHLTDLHQNVCINAMLTRVIWCWNLRSSNKRMDYQKSNNITGIQTFSIRCSVFNSYIKWTRKSWI